MEKSMSLCRVFTLVTLLAACGWGCGSPPPPDSTPFAAAVTAYLKANSMDLKVFAFKKLTVTGDQAEASVSLEYAGGMVGPKVRWKFWFARKDGQWTVTKHKQ